MELERENKRLKVLIVILLLVLLGFGGFYYYTTYVKVDDNKVVNNIDNCINAEEIITEESQESGKSYEGTLLNDRTEAASIFKKLVGNWVYCEVHDENGIKSYAGHGIIIKNEHPSKISWIKFNSSGSESYIDSIRKLSDTKYIFNVLTPADYNDDPGSMSFNIETIYSSFLFDISEIDNGILKYTDEYHPSNWLTMEYAGTTGDDLNNYIENKIK